MKTRLKTVAITLAIITIHLSPFTFRLHASVPLAWDVRPGQPAPVMFDRYHGETIDFSATFRGFGELPFVPGADIRLWYQTNGMGSAWWSVSATIQSNVLSATWSPVLDPGADRVSLFFGAPSNAYAAAVLRLRHSPGFAPGAMPDPIAFHESDPVFTTWLSSFQESDPVFSSWLASYTPPDTSLEPATNYTDRSLGTFAGTGTVARAGSYGTTERWTDAQGCVWEAVRSDEWSAVNTGLPAGEDVEWHGPSWVTETDGDYYPSVGWYISSDNRTPELIGSDLNATTLWLDWGFWRETELFEVHTVFSRQILTNLVGRVALTNDIPAAPDLSPIEQEISDLRTESALVYRLYSGSNVVAEVTNYNSQVHAPELRLMQLNESNEYITVWTETNGLTRTLAKANEYTDAAITNRAAPRAWSKVTAGLGFEAPSNTTWLSTGRTVIAGGLEYEKHMTSGGAIWLLESNGMTADFHAQTNNTAFIDLSNADGTPIFRVEKTDSFLVGVHVDRVSIDGSALVCGVNVVAADHPLVRVKASLESGEWAKEEDGIPASLANVTWSGTTGNWTCCIQNNTGGNTLFAQMEYFQEGGTKIVNSAAMDVSAGILCKDGVHKVRPVYSNGNITWEVVP